MSDAASTRAATREERHEVAQCATAAIYGLSQCVLKLVHGNQLDTITTDHNTATFMLRAIAALSDDVFELVLDDEEVPLPRLAEMKMRLGICDIERGAVEAAPGKERSHA